MVADSTHPSSNTPTLVTIRGRDDADGGGAVHVGGHGLDQFSSDDCSSPQTNFVNKTSSFVNSHTLCFFRGTVPPQDVTGSGCWMIVLVVLAVVEDL